MESAFLDAERAKVGRARSRPVDEDCRCDCGSLLARLVAEAVEVKCRRCKRVVRIHLPAAARPREATYRNGESLRVTTVAPVG